MSFLNIIRSSSSAKLYFFFNFSSHFPKSILDISESILFCCVSSVDIWYTILFVVTILFWLAHSLFKQSCFNFLYISSLWLPFIFSFWHKLFIISSIEQLSSIFILSLIISVIASVVSIFIVFSVITFVVSTFLSSSLKVLSIIIWLVSKVGIWVS